MDEPVRESRRLTVDPRSPVPPFEQIRAQISALVAGGVLRAGDRMPPVRQLATDLGIAVGTVNRAYRELEAQGLVVTRRRTGTHIGDGAQPTSDVQRDQLLAAAAGDYVRAARTLGADDAAIMAAVGTAVAARTA